MDIKSRIKRFCADAGIPVSRFEKSIGVSNGYVNSISKGIATEKINRIRESYPTLNIDWLISGEGEMLVSQRKKIPLFDSASTVGGYTDTIANMDAAVPSEWIDAGDWFPDATSAIYHQGDSMKEYPSGCILVVRRVNDPTLIINGATYVIETPEYRITKQITDDGEYLTAYSTNTDTHPDGRLIHAPFRIPKDAIRHLDLVLGCVIQNFSNKIIKIK